MSPKQILDAMKLAGGHEIRIAHGPGREEWRLYRPPRPHGAPADRVPAMRTSGSDWAKIDPAHPVTVEFSDPQERPGNNLVAGLRRLRQFMASRGLREVGLDEGPFRRSVTFLDLRRAADPARPPGRTPGAPPTEETLAGMEARLGVDLPADYRAFLLEHRGKPGAATDLEFFRIADRPGDEADLETLADRFRGGSDLPECLVPIAQADEDVICLAVSGPRRGRVLLWSLIEGGFDEDRLAPLADSFAAFLAGLGARQDARNQT